MDEVPTDYEVTVKFSTTDANAALALIETIETVAPYMVDNVDVKVK